MELELRNGDYAADGVGGLRRVRGREALLQRVLFRLTARRGAFPFWETLGSRLWALGTLPAPERPGDGDGCDAGTEPGRHGGGDGAACL